MKSIGLLLLAALLPLSASAATVQLGGGYQLVYSAFNTTFLEPEIAARYGLSRGRDRGRAPRVRSATFSPAAARAAAAAASVVAAAVEKSKSAAGDPKEKENVSAFPAVGKAVAFPVGAVLSEEQQRLKREALRTELARRMKSGLAARNAWGETETYV